MRAFLLWVALLPLAVPAAAQRDFLTTDEADQVRLTQEPNARLKLYLTFARQRIDLLDQLVSEKKTGRTALIREALEDYTKIIETIDIVTDDALKRSLDVVEGIAAVVEEEKKMLAVLEKIEEAEPPDMVRYRFVLATAIETTEDSIELAEQDLGGRTADVLAREREERQKQRSLMTPEQIKERAEAEKRTEQTETEQKRKAPTLRRKGETPPPK